MDIDEIKTELQKFADSNGLNLDIDKVLDVMDAGDFVDINAAMNNSDNKEIFQILQKYRARTNENYNFFSSTNITEGSDFANYVKYMNFKEITESYHKCYSVHDISKLSLQEMKTLVYEDLTSSLTPDQIDAVQQSQANSTASSSSQTNPVVAAKMKQQDIQQNAGDDNFKVSVPSSNTGQTSVQSVVGVDAGQSPEQSLVVTKDPNDNSSVQVYPINSVNTIQDQNVQEDTEMEFEPEEPTEENMYDICIEPDEDCEIEEPSDEDIVNSIIMFCKKMGC